MIVKIERLNHQGEGIATVNGKITFVPKTLPGEIVDISILNEKKKINIARINKIIEKSSERIEVACPYYNECGGCDFAHTSYENELNLKREKVKNILNKYANINMEIEVIPSDKSENYRNKITLHQKNGKIGFYKKNSKDLLEIKSCNLVDDNINKAICKLQNENEEIVVKVNDKGEILSNEKNGQFIINACNNKFIVDSDSFFQVNPYCFNKLFEYIKDNVKENCILLDLYCGVGTFSIILSEKFKKIYGIELNENAYINAHKNKELNNKNNIEFLLGKVEDEIKNINEEVDTILIDPPRSGLDSQTISFIEKNLPKTLIYISCNPLTLARDLNILKEKFIINSIKCFDMFPRTNHVETVVFLNTK